MNFSDLLKAFPLAPEGPHTAVLVSWIDRGLQPGKFGARRQVGLKFELPDIETDDGEPMLVFTTVFNLSLRSKSFREMATALMQASDLGNTDVRELVGKTCRITIVHNEGSDGQVFANIASYKACRGKATPMSELTFFSLDLLDTPDMATLKAHVEALSESERGKVQASETYKELVATFKHVAANKGKPASEIIKDSLPDDFGDDFPDDLPGDPGHATELN